MKINPTHCPNCKNILSRNGYLVSCVRSKYICPYNVRYYVSGLHSSVIEIYVRRSGEGSILLEYIFNNSALNIYINDKLITSIKDYIVDNDLTNIFELFKKQEQNLIFL